LSFPERGGPREDDLVVALIRLEEGGACGPEKPGPGVELDEEPVRRYCID
jgi:hypothetical protein